MDVDDNSSLRSQARKRSVSSMSVDARDTDAETSNAGPISKEAGSNVVPTKRQKMAHHLHPTNPEEDQLSSTFKKTSADESTAALTPTTTATSP